MKWMLVLALVVVAGIGVGVMLRGRATVSVPAAVAATEAVEAQTRPVDVKWSVDYAGAMALAKGEGKLVLLNFTGSDWCEPCKLLHAQVFESREFAVWAREKLVLVEVDFPSGRKLPEEVAKQNSSLKWKYLGLGYPTVVIVDGEGNLMGWKLGYSGEKAEEWIAGREKEIQAGREIRAKREAAMAVQTQ